MDEQEKVDPVVAMREALVRAMTEVSEDASVRLNALASLYVEICFFGGLGINETANGVARVYQQTLDSLRPKTPVTPDTTTN